jgi:hypothetical protein
MTSNNDPDKKMEKAESTEDEELIELKEETFDMSQDDEEIIDLLEAADDVSQDNEEIIDLLEAADEPDVEDEKQGVSAQEVESSEEIITLTEELSDTPQEIEEIGEPLHITLDTSEEVEDLTDLNADLLEEPGILNDEFGQEVVADQALSDDFVDSLGMELDSKEDISEDVLGAEKVSDAQVEAALERVIRNMFYEKIDGILVEVIEKTVTREIERLKNILLQDAAGNEK